MSTKTFITTESDVHSCVHGDRRGYAKQLSKHVLSLAEKISLIDFKKKKKKLNS